MTEYAYINRWWGTGIIHNPSIAEQKFNEDTNYEQYELGRRRIWERHTTFVIKRFILIPYPGTAQLFFVKAYLPRPQDCNSREPLEVIKAFDPTWSEIDFNYKRNSYKFSKSTNQITITPKLDWHKLSSSCSKTSRLLKVVVLHFVAILR